MYLQSTQKSISATEVGFGIVEVYETANGAGWTERSMAPASIMAPDDPLGNAKALDELRWQLTEMLKAVNAGAKLHQLAGAKLHHWA
jgi:hypothetical protein